MKKFKLKRGDEVIVITGKDKGKKGSIMKVLTDSDRLIVGGINMVKRHQKPSQLSQGGIIEKEASIHISNVALVDPKLGKPTRVGFKFDKDGEKFRFSKRSGEAVNG